MYRKKSKKGKRNKNEDLDNLFTMLILIQGPIAIHRLDNPQEVKKLRRRKHPIAAVSKRIGDGEEDFFIEFQIPGAKGFGLAQSEFSKYLFRKAREQNPRIKMIG